MPYTAILSSGWSKGIRFLYSGIIISGIQRRVIKNPEENGYDTESRIRNSQWKCLMKVIIRVLLHQDIFENLFIMLY